MTAKKTPDVAKAPPKPASVKAKVPLKTTAKPKSAAPPKKATTAKNLLKLKPKKNPKNLDRLYIPGMTEGIDGYDLSLIHI